MERSEAATSSSRGSLRWAILRHAIKIPHSPSVDEHSFQKRTKDISRKTHGGFKLISCCPLNDHMVGELHSMENKFQCGPNELFACYTLPVHGDTKLVMIQRLDDCIDLDDFKISNKHDIDTTGLIYVQRTININASAFGDTKVKSMILHWNEELNSEMLHNFDIIIASDCTFFKEFHECLANTVKSLLKKSETSEAIFFCPRRGDSLDKFLVKIKETGLNYDLVENYDSNIWNLNQKFRNEDDSSWPNYDEDHCYPFLLRITMQKPKTTSTTKP